MRRQSRPVEWICVRELEVELPTSEFQKIKTAMYRLHIPHSPGLCLAIHCTIFCLVNPSAALTFGPMEIVSLSFYWDKNDVGCSSKRSSKSFKEVNSGNAWKGQRQLVINNTSVREQSSNARMGWLSKSKNCARWLAKYVKVGDLSVPAVVWPLHLSRNLRNADLILRKASATRSLRKVQEAPKDGKRNRHLLCWVFCPAWRNLLREDITFVGATAGFSDTGNIIQRRNDRIPKGYAKIPLEECWL
jgi:hypothetical protein